MNKTLYTLALLFAAATAPAVADSASDLLTAQSAYQHALKAANSNSGEIALLQSRLRTLLLLVDGTSTVGELRSRLHRFRSLDEALDMLLRMGLIERLPTALDL